MKGLDLSKFKVKSRGEKHTVMVHPSGHKITVFHDKLSPKLQESLKALPMAEGGTVPGYEGLKENYRADNFKTAKKRGDKILRDQLPNFAEGGTAKPTPTPSPTPTLPGAQSAQDSMRKAFHFAEGSANVEMPLPDMPVTPSTPYPMEEEQAQANTPMTTQDQISQATSDVPTQAPISPITPEHVGKLIDMAHSASQPVPQQSQNQPVATPQSNNTPSGINTPQTPNTVPDQVPQGGLVQQAQQNTNLANQAETAAAQNVGQGEAQKSQIYGQQQQQLQDLHAKFEAIGNDLHHKYETTAAEVAQGRIDPNGWWNNRSAPSKILTAIGMMISGAMTGASGHPEMASNAINKIIDNDIDAQKNNLQNKQNLLSKYMEMYRSLPEAENAARLTMHAAVEGMINQQASKTNSANAINAATMANAARRQQLLPQLEGLAKGQMMMGLYGDMSKPQAPASDGETAYQNQMQRMRLINPDLGKDMENKYIPSVGVARVPIPDKLREKLATQGDLSHKLAELENFAREHSGTVMDREIVNRGKTMAANVQSALRVAQDQGVFKESDQKFITSMVDSDPTAFFGKVRTIPKYQEIRRQNDDSVKAMHKAYGIKSFQSSQPSQEQPKTATMNGRQYQLDPTGKFMVPVK